MNINWKHTTCLPQAQLCVTPKFGYVDLSVTPLSTTWRQRRLSPKYQIQNYTVTLNTIPHTSRNTRCHLNILLRHFVSNTNKPKLHESCSTKSKPYSMLQIKKNFLCCVVKEKFRHSFVLPKNIVLEKLTTSRTAIQPSQLLITQFRLNKHNFSTSLAAPKANPIFHAANKNLFIKIYFDYRHLTS